MNDSLLSSDVAANRTYGVRFQPGLAVGYPELVGKMRALYTQRIAKLPWVPKSWLAGVEKLQASRPNDLVLIFPAVLPNGSTAADSPLFLDTPDKLEAWKKIHEDTQKAVQAYARGQAEAGADELNDLYADAAFWDAATNVAIFVRDAPGRAIGAVGTGIFDAAGATLKGITGKSAVTWIVLGVIAYFVWKNRAKLLPSLKLGGASVSAG